MKIFLVLSLFLLSGCFEEEQPAFPKDIMYVMDKKFGKCYMYELPDMVDGKPIYKGETVLDQCYEFSDSQSLYCIRPGYYLDLRKYGKDLHKYIKNILDRNKALENSCQVQQQ